MYNNKQKALILINMVETSINRKNVLADRLTKLDSLVDNITSVKGQIVTLLDEKIYNQLTTLLNEGGFEKELSTAEKLGVSIVTKHDSEYPYRLKEIPAPPIVLYCMGDVKLLNSENILAIVGTRTPSRYGMDVTDKFATELSVNGFIIVSGMARGIDAVAHKACMQNGKPTIAVLGSGVDVVYPPDNFAIYEYIKAKGLIISEYPLRSDALKYHFPERNRIISGISDGLLVTEAGEKSGSLITLNCAVEHGKHIFVIPSNITNKYARGTNKAIKEMPCSCVTDVNDIYDAYNMEKKLEAKKATGLQLDIIEQMIVTALEVGELHFEELLQVTNLKVHELSALLAKLEFMGVLKNIGGNNFSL